MAHRRIVEMPDNTKDTVTLKIWPADRDWIAEEQLRLRKTEGVSITQAALFARMRRAHEANIASPDTSLVQPATIQSPDADSIVLKITKAESPWVEKLLRVLRSNKKRFLFAVTSNLDIFASYCERDADDGPPDLSQAAAPNPTPGGHDTGAIGEPHPGPTEPVPGPMSIVSKANARSDKPKRRRKSS